MQKLNFLLGSIVLLVGCGERNQLWGSIRESHSLEFDRAEVVQQGPALRIEYLRAVDGNSEWVCKLIVDTEGLGLSATSQIKAAVFNQHVVLERTVHDSETLPRHVGGSLYFDQYATMPGSTMAGDFNVLFDNGRTLSGSFSSPLEVADAGDLAPPRPEELHHEKPPGAGTGVEDDDYLQPGGCACYQSGSHNVSMLFGLPLVVWVVLARRRRPRG